MAEGDDNDTKMEEEKKDSQSSSLFNQSTSEKENARNPQNFINSSDEADAANILLALRSSDTSELTSSKELNVGLSYLKNNRIF